jgi:hypothetical protein
MIRIKWLLCAFLLASVFGREAKGNTLTAASCNTSDVQAAINSAAEGDTVNIPAGTCTWTSGVTISGKGIIVQGAGGGRIIAYSSTTLAVSTGSQTLSILSTLVSGSPTSISVPATITSISNGETLHISETGNRQNFIQGTVTSFNSSTGSLVMNITSTGGECGNSVSGQYGSNCARWLISTIPQTVIVNNSTTSSIFAIREDSSFHTHLSGIKIAQGTGTADAVDFGAGGGAAIVLQNCWIEQTGDHSVHFAANRGVVSNCSFDSTPFSTAPNALDPQPFDQTAWNTPSYWGALDTDGQHNVYIETSDFHAYLVSTDNDEGARTVYRYNTYNNAGLGGHGADTGPFGARSFEMYNNVMKYNGYSSCTPTCYTFPMSWWYFLRGGSFVVYNNTMDPLQSTDYGTKDDINMTVMNLQRGQNSISQLDCWGAGNGAAGYPAPHQVGRGYINGTSSTLVGGKGPGTETTYSPAAYGYSVLQAIGDLEPGYIWNNSRVPLGNTGTSDYGLGNSNSCASSPTPATSASYIVSGRDYFNGTTAKPGYTPYTYPHPLTLGQSSGGNPPVDAPSNLTATVQ